MVRKTPEGFPWHYRIVRGADYRSVYSAGLKFHSERFVLFGTENRLGHHRLGITVSRKVGPAVVRNRIKRLFREIFRRSISGIPNTIDLVVNGKHGCASARYQDLRTEFLCAVERLCRQLEGIERRKDNGIRDLPDSGRDSPA